jgi:hypothetical protein
MSRSRNSGMKNTDATPGITRTTIKSNGDLRVTEHIKVWSDLDRIKRGLLRNCAPPAKPLTAHPSRSASTFSACGATATRQAAYASWAAADHRAAAAAGAAADPAGSGVGMRRARPRCHAEKPENCICRAPIAACIMAGSPLARPSPGIFQARAAQVSLPGVLSHAASLRDRRRLHRPSFFRQPGCRRAGRARLAGRADAGHRH